MLSDTNREEIRKIVSGHYFLINQLHVSKQCLELALKEMTPQIEPNNGFNRLHAFFSTGVIEYAKCFASSGKGRITVSKKKIFNNNPNYLALHDELMDIRHQYSAHNDEVSFIKERIDIIEKNKEIIVSTGARYHFGSHKTMIKNALFLNDIAGDAIGPMLSRKLKKLSKHLGVTVRQKTNRDFEKNS